MPTSIQSFTTYIPRSLHILNENNIPSEKPFIRELKIEEPEPTRTSELISVPKKERKHLKVLIGLCLGGILVSVSILVPLIIRINKTATTTTTTTSTTLNTTIVLTWNTTGATAMGITGQIGTGSNQLQRPFGLAIDSSSSLYIADAANHRVQKYLFNASSGTTVAGQSNGTPGTGSNAFQYCSDVVVDANGNLYITDILNSRVQLWTNGSSTGITVAGTGTAGSTNNTLNSPYGIARDPVSNTLYISDSSNNRIMRYISGASSGSVVAGGNGNGTGSTQLSRPAGLYFDSSSNSLIIANSAANNIVRWVLGANSWTLIAGNLNGASGTASNELNFPGDVTLDSLGNIYVADTNNHRIQFYLSGQSNGTTIAGITNVLGSNSTMLNYPRSVILDSEQNLYVSDTENDRIQKFSRY